MNRQIAQLPLDAVPELRGLGFCPLKKRTMSPKGSLPVAGSKYPSSTGGSPGSVQTWGNESTSVGLSTCRCSRLIW